jgi:hypothetical protein
VVTAIEDSTASNKTAKGEHELTDFLFSFDDRLPWKKSVGSIKAFEILRGSGETGLSVVVAGSPSEPSKPDLQAMWKARAGQSADPVLLVVEYPTVEGPKISVFGPDRDAVAVSNIEVALAERLAERALESDSPVGLVVELRRRLSSLQGSVGPGFRNEGLFASHVLAQQPQLPNWPTLCSQSNALLPDRGEQLLQGLGYKIEHVPDGVVLRDETNGSRRAAAVLMLEQESFENPLGRFAGSNAVAHGLALARRENVPWLILIGGSVARLFPADPDVGVGRKGQTQTYAEVDLDLLTEATSGYLSLLFSPEALAADGTVAELLDESSKYATGLSDRLRDRIYEDVIPSLSTAVAARSDVWNLPVDEQKDALEESYHQAMVILFRMLFVAYAEDRELLPLGKNEAYTANALNTLARRMLDDPERNFSETSTSLWNDLTQIWQVIDTGDLEGMGVPAYNGGLFTQDKKKNPVGAATYKLRLNNSEIGPVIRGLMIDNTSDGFPGLVDFRSLDVREFGTIYEGLLESGLAIADSDLTVDNTDTFVPAKTGEDVIVEKGSVYFHSRSGSRKATGSYFTKPFAVQHLLNQALEPALDDHLERVKGLLAKRANKSAAEALFDFRVADLSMGSAHFLVAAVDRIEARFSAFIAENPMPEVQNELNLLRATAATQLGQTPDESGIDDGIFLRRQIARRCIYGIDINEIAVELARLAIWIHTFVPGLPLSFLNHGLIHGNSLTGVGTIQEITNSIREAQEREDKNHQADGMFDINQPLEELLARADTHLATLATLTGASINEVQQVQDLYQEVTEALEPLTALCDLITAERTTRKLKLTDPNKFLLIGGTNNNLTNALTADELEQAILKHPQLKKARQVAHQIHAAHLPTAYAEVFRREPSGFDVILGNPPWEKLKVEEHGWWGARFPGLRSMSQQDKNEAIAAYRESRLDLVAEFEDEVAAAKKIAGIITAGPFPGIGATDIDLFAAFCWRFWHETRSKGKIGVVLPRSALSGASAAMWRRQVLESGAFSDITTLVNNRHWAFDIHPQWTIALVIAEKDAAEHQATLRGPFSSMNDYLTGMSAESEAVAEVPASEVFSWSESASIPLIPAQDVDVFTTMKRHPALSADVSEWSFRPVAELHTSKEKRFYDFNLASPEKGATLPVWTGSTFNLWSPGSGEPYAYAQPEEIEQLLQDKRANQIRLKSSAFYGLSEEWAADPKTLPMRSPRIAFRDVCRATDSRTMICALVPGGVALVHVAPYLFRKRGHLANEAYLVGVLSSIPFDWLTRRFVELHMTFDLLNYFPVPRIDPQSGSALNAQGLAMPDGIDLRPVRDRVIEISGRLAAVDDRFAAWAKEVGVPVGSVKTPEEKEALIAELDALVSLLYGLSRGQVEQVFATFHRGWDYKPRLAAVLAQFDKWSVSLGEGK